MNSKSSIPDSGFKEALISVQNKRTNKEVVLSPPTPEESKKLQQGFKTYAQCLALVIDGKL